MKLIADHRVTHVALDIDESTSMRPHRAAVVAVVDNLVAELAGQSKALDQEVRLSVYAFNSRGTARCLVWDMDVLRFPSISGLYQPGGFTALIDCACLTIDDLRTVPQKYGDHAFLAYVVTDGEENDSRKRPADLNGRIGSLDDNWTLGVFVPGVQGVQYAKACGFSADAIEKWDPSGHRAVERIGERIRETASDYLQARSTGFRGSRGGLFGLKQFGRGDVLRDLVPVTPGSYQLFPVDRDRPIKDFVYFQTRGPYTVGTGYYQLARKVKIQAYKQVFVLMDGQLYGGPQARQLLGLPDYDVEFDAGDAKWRDYKIFVQSTSANRKLLGGTTFLLMRG